jgi:hypothetical protein
MDENEQRIAAHEMALIEVVAHLDRDHVEAGLKAIRAGLMIGISEDERVIRCQAIQLLEDAMGRFDPPAGGMFIQGAGWPPGRA